MLSRFTIFNPLGVDTRCTSKAISKACSRHFIQMHHTKPIQQQQQYNIVQHTFNNSNNVNTTTNLLFYRKEDLLSELYMLQHENDDSFDGGVLVDLLPDITSQINAKRWWNPLFAEVSLEFELVGSCNGLLCLTDAVGYTVILLNPVNGDYMKLPSLRHKPGFPYVSGSVLDKAFPVVSGFGFDEVANLYKVITVVARYNVDQFDDDCTCTFEAYVHTVGSGEWRKLGDIPYKIPYKISIFDDPRYFQKEQVLVNGAIHWLLEVEYNNQFGHILAFHVGREEFQIISLPPGFTPSDLHRREFTQRAFEFPPNDLLHHDFTKRGFIPSVWHPDWAPWSGCLWGLGGYLCVLHESDDQCDIWVMKEYGVQGSWTKEYVIPREGPGFSSATLSPVILTKNGNILVNVDGESLFYFDRKRFSQLTIREGVLTDFDLVLTHVPSPKLIRDIIGQTVSKVELKTRDGT